MMMKKRIVVKIGGSTLASPETLSKLAELVRGYQRRQYQVIVVHGGGPAVNAELTARGITWKFINGQRQTTPEMIDIIEDVLARKVNGALVGQLRDFSINAVSMSGAQNLLFCSQASVELMQVGTVEFVSTETLESLLAGPGRVIPVIAPIGVGNDSGGNAVKYNINADWAATQIAIAVQARILIFLTDQEGVLDQNRELIAKARPSLMRMCIEQGVIAGGMMTKVNAMIAAVNAGVGQVRVLNAASAGLLLTNDKIGTLLTGEIMTNKRGVLHERAS